MKYINLFPTQASYDAADKYYPNVSYIVGTDEVKYQETDPKLMVAKYTTTSANQNVLITAKKEYFSRIIVDGNTYTISGTGGMSYTFATAGEHEVELRLINSSIGSFAFDNCNKMTSISIPPVTLIDGSAFRNCRGLTSVTIPDSVTTIGGTAFSGCTGLTSVTISDSVTSIGGSAFFDCSGLTSVTIPNSVTTIGDYAFSGNTSLSGGLSIPSSVTSIGKDPFKTTDITSITVDSSNTAYNDGNGGNCIIKTSTNELIKGCRNTVIPNTVTSLNAQAFSKNTALTSITIPASVTSIGLECFYNCTGMTSLTCLATVPPTLDYWVFSSVPATCAIYVPAESVSAYQAASGWSSRAAYIQAIPAPVSTTIAATFTTSSPNMSVCITNKQQLFSEITVEGSQQTIGTGRMNYTFATAGDHVVTYTAVDTTAIGMDAFDDCRGLTSITIPNSVTSIEDEAFNGCYDLVSITLSDSLITIGEYTFSGTAITSLTIPEGVTTIGDDAFRECEYLDNITLPSTLTSIGSGAFSSCTAITSMTCYATTPPTAGEYALTDIASDSPVFVPAASVSAYQSASGWSRLYIEPIQD